MELRQNPAVSLRIHITGADSAVTQDKPSALPLLSMLPARLARDKELGAKVRPLMHSRSAMSSELSTVYEHGRPDVDELITCGIAGMPNTKKVLIAGKLYCTALVRHTND